jgi:tetratricopeptide (TPR) repeat protein
MNSLNLLTMSALAECPANASARLEWMTPKTVFGALLALGAMVGIAHVLQPITVFGGDLIDCMQPNDMPRVVAACTGLLEANATHPHVAMVFRNRSNAYAALGDFERAEQDYQCAIAANPNYLKLSRRDVSPQTEH